MVAAAASCAMNGNPVRWSSLPVVALAACLTLGGPVPRPSRRPPVALHVALIGALAALAWSALAAAYHFDAATAVALLGGAGGVVLGFRVGLVDGGSTAAVDRMLRGAAAGYAVHATAFLSWFVSRAGWNIIELMGFRWEPGAFIEAESVGFGNLGNNAVLAAMVLPCCLCIVARRGHLAWRLLGAGSGLLAAAVLAIIQARAPIIVAAAVSAVVLVALRARLLFLVIAVLTVAAAGWILSGNHDLTDEAAARWGLGTQGQAPDASIEDRSEAMQQGWASVADEPLLGIGVANVSEAMMHTSPHQWHLHQAIEWGAPAGLAWAVATIGLMGSFAASAAGSLRGRDRQPDAMACLAMPTAYLAIGCASGAQWHFGLASVWPTLCGLGFGAAWALETRRQPTLARGTGPSTHRARSALRDRSTAETTCSTV